ncbi:hypothetical protein NPIL_530251 [Nephila pilipes]|uniref:Uncharacterized protein n=1 Tax=Nephila pilipes TaxID=299642 RepID=A0A8X6T161_NEPPI|nr:hypothetical protein NPIL_530251 [Nephila pilipes]
MRQKFHMGFNATGHGIYMISSMGRMLRSIEILLLTSGAYRMRIRRVMKHGERGLRSVMDESNVIHKNGFFSRHSRINSISEGNVKVSGAILSEISRRESILGLHPSSKTLGLKREADNGTCTKAGHPPRIVAEKDCKRNRLQPSLLSLLQKAH